MSEDIRPPENPVETMRNVMAELGRVDYVKTDESVGVYSPLLITVPQGRKVENLTKAVRDAMEWLHPMQRRGTARLQSLDSLILWANRFKDADSALFADSAMARPSLTAIADYHQAGAEGLPHLGSTNPVLARHGHHRAVYDFPLSDEWKAWNAISGKPLDKDEMGEFIEANAKDVFDPTPDMIAGKVKDTTAAWEARLIETAQKIEGRYGQLTQLLAMSRRFQVYETSNLEVKTNRDTGEQEIQFLNEHRDKDGAPLKVPNLIVIAIPVFRNGAPYRMPVRFRYRKTGASVKFILSIYAPERSFKDAFEEAANAAAEATGLPLFVGTPEA